MPHLQRVLAQPAQFGRRAQPGDFGTGAGEAQVAQAIESVGQVAGQFFDAEMTQQVAVQAAEVREEINELISDPGLDLERFDKESKEILKRHEETISSRRFKSDFSLQVGGLIERGRVRVRSNIWARQVDSAKAKLDRAGRLLADQFGKARTETEKFEIRDEFFTLMAIAESQHLIKDQERFRREQAFQKEALGSDIREAIREDAASAVDGLLAGTLGSGLPEAEIQVWLDRAVAKHSADIRQGNAESARLDREKKAADRAEHKAAKTELDLLLDTSDRGTPSEAAEAMGQFNERFEQLFPLFTSAERKSYRVVQMEGGGIGGAATNPGVYNTLYSLASVGALTTTEGELLTDEIEEAYRLGNLRLVHRDSLLATQDDRRFGDSELFLKRSLKVGESAFGEERFIAQQKSAQALQAFTDWKLQNPTASREDATKFVDRLVRAASLEELLDIEIANLQPFFAIKDPNNPNRIDVLATRRATKAEADREGGLSAFDYAVQLRWIERIERAQGLADR